MCVQDVSSSGMDESSAENTLHAIAIRLRSLDASIRHLVSLHQEELLAQAGQAAALKSSVQGIDARTERLVKAAARLKREVITPFEELKGHVRLLERLQVHISSCTVWFVDGRVPAQLRFPATPCV